MQDCHPLRNLPSKPSWPNRPTPGVSPIAPAPAPAPAPAASLPATPCTFHSSKSPFTVISWGAIHRGPGADKYWSTTAEAHPHLYPVGYSITRRLYQRHFRACVRASGLDGADGPEFVVEDLGAGEAPADAALAMFFGDTPTRVWREVVARSGGAGTKTTYSGPMQFGMHVKEVVAAVEVMYTKEEREEAARRRQQKEASAAGEKLPKKRNGRRPPPARMPRVLDVEDSQLAAKAAELGLQCREDVTMVHLLRIGLLKPGRLFLVSRPSSICRLLLFACFSRHSSCILPHKAHATLCCPPQNKEG
jgi:hypothetical protein